MASTRAAKTAAIAPRLEVVVGSGTASPVNIQATGTLANGNTRSLTRAANPAYQPPNIVTLQLGTDPGADAMLDDFYPRNYGGRDFVQVNENTGSWLQRPVLRFDLGGVPAHAAVLSAQLELRMQEHQYAGHGHSPSGNPQLGGRHQERYGYGGWRHLGNLRWDQQLDHGGR